MAALSSQPVFPQSGESSSTGSHRQSSSSSTAVQAEKAPSLIDPAGPTISLISSEPVFIMAAALNACGYDEGLEESAPVRKRVRDEINQALAKSEDARAKRDKVCLFIAQHRMTGTENDISQYISLALYLSPPPEMETTVDLPEMPPDSTQVVEIVPVLTDFAAAVDLHGIWLTVAPHLRRRDRPAARSALGDDRQHQSLSQDARLHLRRPPLHRGHRAHALAQLVNARIYGTDYIVVVSPVNGKIRMSDVRHTYLHYVIEPLLYPAPTPSTARSRSSRRFATLPSISATAPTPCRSPSSASSRPSRRAPWIPAFPSTRFPPVIDRSELPRYEHERQVYQEKVDAVRVATVQHDMTQGFVLTQYFYEQMIQFEKDPASLRTPSARWSTAWTSISRCIAPARPQFDKEADDDVLQRSKPRKLTGLDLAEARLAGGDVATASALARQALTVHGDSLESVADAARANFILARAAIMTGHPDEAIDHFQKTIATSKDPRLLAWSHIYLGRMLDLDCKRDEALSEYKEALATRDGAAGYASGRRARRQDRLRRQGPQLRRRRRRFRRRSSGQTGSSGEWPTGDVQTAVTARRASRRAPGSV